MKETRKTPASYIKEALKQNFPWVKFSCKYKSFSMGDSVDVSWKGWPSEKEVEKIAFQFQMWTFNGMEDIYEYFDTDKPTEQLAKYVFCKREPAENEDKEIIKEIETKTEFTRQSLIDMINRDCDNTWQKYDWLKMSVRQHLQEIGYNYDEASDKAWIVYNQAYKEGLFAF